MSRTVELVARWGARTLVAVQALVVADAVWLVAHVDGLASIGAVAWLAVVILVLIRLLRRYDRMTQPVVTEREVFAPPTSFREMHTVKPPKPL